MPLTRSEALVANLCEHSFLSLWSYANPKGKDGDELCDMLIVCDPDVIVFSVKEIEIKGTGEVHRGRWNRKAVEASVRQIYGAESWIRRNKRVTRSDGEYGLAFPEGNRLRFHRVAVALGGKGLVSIPQGDFGKGFVHVFEEEALHVLLRELDTVTDFVSYLSAKEELLASLKEDKSTVAREASLLAAYIRRGRSLEGIEVEGVPMRSWEDLTGSPEFIRRKSEDSVSYLWDRLTEILAGHIERATLEYGPELTDSEQIVRVMAREDRFSRRVLAAAFKDAYTGREVKVRSRLSPSPNSRIVYVYLFSTGGDDREMRRHELQLRCVVARDLHEDIETVIGLAAEPHEPTNGFSIDALLFHYPEWTEELKTKAKDLREQFGYFVAPRRTRILADEFPTGGNDETAGGCDRESMRDSV